jgi:pyridinium-3,5-biscarboxylic acid mononucleotide sulfurtransferase
LLVRRYSATIGSGATRHFRIVRETEAAVFDTPELDRKYQELTSLLQSMNSVVVAFSAGVDSTLLLRASRDALGAEHVIAATGLSDTYPEEEMQEARDLAVELGVEHVMARTEELTDPRYAQNSHQRCFFCKHELYTHLERIRVDRGFQVVVDGTNADDLGDHRPGLRAARNLGVRSPLEEVGMTKDDIRRISNSLGLRTWDKPAFACLSSRFPYGTTITVEKLRQVAEAERVLRRLGFKGFRVRHHDRIARIEVNPNDFERLVSVHEEIVSGVKAAGYRFVTLDLNGYVSGGMNDELPPTVRSVSVGADRSA